MKNLYHRLKQKSKADLTPFLFTLLAEVHAKVLARGNRNMATIAVARKMAEFLLAVDRRGTPFVIEAAA
ncbi:MAG: hypothetical protein R6W72_13750 [Desulfurivibrionaceae bacterium]